MPLTRLHNWQENLTEFLRERREMPFAWGQNDCALFACDAVLAMTGVDLAEPFRGRYSEAIGALAAIREFTGGSDLADVGRIQAEWFGIQEIEPAFAMLGDAVLANGIHGPTLGICLGSNAISAGVDGIVESPTIEALAVWRI